MSDKHGWGGDRGFIERLRSHGMVITSIRTAWVSVVKSFGPTVFMNFGPSA